MMHRLLLFAALVSAPAGVTLGDQAEADPHRPTCTSARCRKIKSFVKEHYCGRSPAGNGPDDGCEITRPTKHSPGVEVLADYKCYEAKEKLECRQEGVPPPSVRDVLTRELRSLGLPANAPGNISFVVLRASSWLVASADYSWVYGEHVEVCRVVVLVDANSHATVLRKTPFEVTDADTDMTTGWTPIDIADADGTGHPEIILVGQAYEDRWFEVVSLEKKPFRTIFSGLGYYL